MAHAESPYVTVAGQGVLAFVGRDAGRTVVWLRGAYDASSVAALAELMARAIAVDDGDLVVDLNQVQFMDEASAGVLVRVREFLGRQSRSLVLRSPPASARRALDVCGLSDLFDAPPVDATPRIEAVDALGTWVTVPATDRVGPRDDEPSPESTIMRANAPTDGGGGVLVVAGELDLDHVGDLRQRLMAAINGAHDTVLVDLSQVSFIDSSCVGVLLYANRIAPIHGRELILRAPSPECLKALDDLGVLVLFTVREPAPVDAARRR